MDLKEFNKVASSNGAQVDKTGINFPLTGRDEDFAISIITDDFPLLDFALVREDGDVVYELGQYEMDENFYQRLVSTVRKACSRYGISNFSRFSTFLKRVTTSKTSASLKRSQTASATDTFMNNLERLFKGIARKNNLKVDYIPTIARTEWEEVEEGSVLSKKTRDGEYCWIIGNDSGWNGNGEDGIAIMLDGEDSNIGTTGVQTSYTTLIKEAENLAKKYGLTLPREIVNVAKDLKAKKVLASFGDSNMNISETKAVTAHLLMAALQVKAGNLRKAQRIMASLDDEEVDEAIDQNLDVLDEAEEAEIQDDPFLLGEEASNEDNFDLSPEDDEVEAEYEDDEEVEDEDEPAETARFRSSHRRKQTASLQRQNNVRLLRAANKR